VLGSSHGWWCVLRFIDPANAISLVALLSAAACCCLSISRLPAYALVALIVAGLADLFDGQVARRLKRTEEQRQFGSRIDSLVDACSFGFAPLGLLYSIGLNHPLDLVLLGFFVCCVVWRLAYFDTVGMEATGSGRYFIGMPTTYVALVLPLVFLSAFAGTTWLNMSMRGATLLLALAMVSPVRFRKPGAVVYAFFVLLAVFVVSLLIWHSPWLHQTLRM
jgi:CDP-diacylglycerol--serine O-phosphatidyltransferase